MLYIVIPFLESLNNDEWKPVNPGYDFLAMMDNEEYRQKNPKRCLNNSCMSSVIIIQLRSKVLDTEINLHTAKITSN